LPPALGVSFGVGFRGFNGKQFLQVIGFGNNSEDALGKKRFGKLLHHPLKETSVVLSGLNRSNVPAGFEGVRVAS